MPEFNIEVEFEVFCRKCGAGLCQQSDGQVDSRGTPFVEVGPCEKCLDAAETQAYDKGYREGFGEPG